MTFRIIVPGKASYKSIFNIIQCRQQGLCFLCKLKIAFGEVVVSNANKTSKYYHESCARRVRIVV